MHNDELISTDWIEVALDNIDPLLLPEEQIEQLLRLSSLAISGTQVSQKERLVEWRRRHDLSLYANSFILDQVNDVANAMMLSEIEQARCKDTVAKSAAAFRALVLTEGDEYEDGPEMYIEHNETRAKVLLLLAFGGKWEDVQVSGYVDQVGRSRDGVIVYIGINPIGRSKYILLNREQILRIIDEEPREYAALMQRLIRLVEATCGNDEEMTWRLYPGTFVPTGDLYRTQNADDSVAGSEGANPLGEQFDMGEISKALMLLGLKKGAKFDKVKGNFKKKARRIHPDVNKGDNAEDQMKKLNLAYELLMTYYDCLAEIKEKAALNR